MSSPRIEPTEVKRKGRRKEESWPGQIRTTWIYGPVRIIRVQKFYNRRNSNLKSEVWQFEFGKKAAGQWKLL